ncbi:hypothetical protein [Shewanella algae]|uniref:hypothetical protein n=1 Tax=Shewanella algae TaxID=38313 RepID=UPI001C825998|nr:hypothetical protein [Shewanella algae]
MERKVPTSNEDIYSAIGLYSPFNHVTVAFKKDAVLRSGSYRGGKNFQEDLDLWIRMAGRDCKFLNLPMVLVDVRGGDGMLGRRGGGRYLYNELKIGLMGGLDWELFLFIDLYTYYP